MYEFELTRLSEGSQHFAISALIRYDLGFSGSGKSSQAHQNRVMALESRILSKNEVLGSSGVLAKTMTELLGMSDLIPAKIWWASKIRNRLTQFAFREELGMIQDGNGVSPDLNGLWGKANREQYEKLPGTLKEFKDSRDSDTVKAILLAPKHIGPGTSIAIGSIDIVDGTEQRAKRSEMMHQEISSPKVFFGNDAVGEKKRKDEIMKFYKTIVDSNPTSTSWAKMETNEKLPIVIVLYRAWKPQIEVSLVGGDDSV